MQVDLIWVGKARDKLSDELFERYLQRLSRLVRVETAHVAEARGKGRSRDEIRRVEGQRLREALARREGRVVALDERGRSFTTRELAMRLGGHEDRGLKRVSFVIGGAEGLEPELVKEADEVLSLSPLTFPHELARVLLAEQLYRCWSLRAGHPYHRD